MGKTSVWIGFIFFMVGSVCAATSQSIYQTHPDATAAFFEQACSRFAVPERMKVWFQSGYGRCVHPQLTFLYSVRAPEKEGERSPTDYIAPAEDGVQYTEAPLLEGSFYMVDRCTRLHFHEDSTGLDLYVKPYGGDVANDEGAYLLRAGCSECAYGKKSEELSGDAVLKLAEEFRAICCTAVASGCFQDCDSAPRGEDEVVVLPWVRGRRLSDMLTLDRRQSGKK